MLPINNIVGSVSYFAGDYDISNYFPCDGRLLNVQEYSDLFYVIGNRYGGDGITSFALPDLRPIVSGSRVNWADSVEPSRLICYSGIVFNY